MGTPRIRCTIVEVNDHGTGQDSPTSHELLPWADPVIAQLVERYRLRAALDDSLRFLQAESGHDAWSPQHAAAPRIPHTKRFSSLFDDHQGRPNKG